MIGRVLVAPGALWRKHHHVNHSTPQQFQHARSQFRVGVICTFAFSHPVPVNMSLLRLRISQSNLRTYSDRGRSLRPRCSVSMCRMKLVHPKRTFTTQVKTAEAARVVLPEEVRRAIRRFRGWRCRAQRWPAHAMPKRKRAESGSVHAELSQILEQAPFVRAGSPARPRSKSRHGVKAE